MILDLNIDAGNLDATNNHSCDRRIRIHRLSLCTGFIEPRLSGSRSVRNLGRIKALEATLSANGADTRKLDWVAASLTEPHNWSTAVDRCDAIFHIASPAPTIQPNNPADVIDPAIQGTLNVLEANASEGINRVVLTSSVTAILGAITDDSVYTKNDWSDPNDPRMTPYAISKTLAERCA